LLTRDQWPSPSAAVFGNDGALLLEAAELVGAKAARLALSAGTVVVRRDHDRRRRAGELGAPAEGGGHGDGERDRFPGASAPIVARMRTLDFGRV
jgi:hypothetical protein